MPCNGCVGWMAQVTGTFTKYWCPADQSFHFDWEPCVALSPSSPITPTTLSPTLTAPTPVTTLAPSLAPTGVGGCGCCGPSAPSGGGSVTGPGASLGLPVGGGTPSTASLTIASMLGATPTVSGTGAAMPCPCKNGKTNGLPWWVWLLGAAGLLSIVRRVT